MQYSPVSNEIIFDDQIEVGATETHASPPIPEPDIQIQIQDLPSSSKEHDYVSGEIQRLLQVIAQKDSKLAEKDLKIAQYQRLYWNAKKSVKHYKMKLARKNQGIMPMKHKKKIAKEVLKANGKLSDTSLKVLVDGKKFAKNLSSSDLAKALQLRNISKKAYNMVKEIIPIFPHMNTLRKKFSFLQIVPGIIIQPVMVFLKHLVATLGPDHIELLATIGFDEVGLLNLAEIDPRQDTIIGENSYFIHHRSAEVLPRVQCSQVSMLLQNDSELP